MTFKEAIAEFFETGQVSEECGKQLFIGFTNLARKHVWDEDHQGDVASATFLWLVKRGRLLIKSDKFGQRVAYLDKVIQTQAAKLFGGKEELLDDPDRIEGELGVASHAAEDPELLLDYRWEQKKLEDLLEAALEKSTEAVKQDYRAYWREVEDLAFGRVEMEDLIAKELGPGWERKPAKARETARLKLLQRHKRVRDKIVQALDAGVEAGMYSLEDQRVVRGALQQRVRCHRSGASESLGKGGGEDET